MKTKKQVSSLKAMLKEVKAAMKNHHQVVSTEISGEDTVESTSVGNRSSLLLTRQHHHHHGDHDQVNNYHAFDMAEGYNPMVVMPQPPPLQPPSYWNNVMTPSSYP